MTAVGRRALLRREPPSATVRAACPAWVPPSILARVWYWIAIFMICGGSGALYGLISPYDRPWVGFVYGVFSGGAVLLFEHGVVLPRLRQWLRGLPWAASVLATEAVYLAMILIGNVAAGLLLWAPGWLGRSLAQAVTMGPVTVFYALMVSGIVITMMRMRDLIGAEVFRNVLFGRYHRPVEEERIFLFVDLIGSTAYAQTHGDLAAQRFLGAIFEALAAPVRDHGGTIDDYVGDMALVTWPMRKGATEARCIACALAFLDAIDADAETWRRRFGQVPRFHLAMHGGAVVTAEVGVDRHKISYFGDVVNTTGRIEALCRTLDAHFLVSADLCERLDGLPPGTAARRLGAHALKGRGQLLDVLAIERVGALEAEVAA